MTKKRYTISRRKTVWEENIIVVPADTHPDDVIDMAWDQGEWKQIDSEFHGTEIDDVEDVSE